MTDFPGLINLTQDELTTLFDTHYTYNDPTINQHFWNDVNRLQNMHTRYALITEYNITTDDFGHYIFISDSDASRLLFTQLAITSSWINKLATSEYFSDDDTDYLNAATDQIVFLTRLIIADDANTDTLLACLNETDPSATNEDHMAFAYGYADFSSPISDLSHINDEN